MLWELPEVRALCGAAKDYLAGRCSIHELNGNASQLADAARLFKAHPAVKVMAEEWSGMIDRRWNEWGHVEEPVSEEEFRVWLQTQLEAL